MDALVKGKAVDGILSFSRVVVRLCNARGYLLRHNVHTRLYMARFHIYPISTKDQRHHSIMC